jgi:WD40 repeat protein
VVGMLAHWLRRHRLIAISATAALGLATAGSVLYLHNITAARERAEKVKNDLVLEHSALLLHTDPTAAAAALADYRGDDPIRRSELLAEASGRGIAHSIVHPHNDTIWFLAGQPDGSFISVGEDHRVRRTIGTSTTTLASNVSYTVHCAYAPIRKLLAYSTSPNGLALMDLTTSQVVTLDIISPVSLGFTPDGSLLAALDKHGSLIIWNTSLVPTVIYRAIFPEATGVNFVQPSRLLLIERSGLRSLDFASASSLRLNGDIVTIDANDRYVVAGFADGTIAILSQSLKAIATAPLCKQRVKVVAALPGPGHDLIAFACSQGGIGLARYLATEHTLATVDTLSTITNVWLMSADHTGTNLLAVSDRTAYAYDVNTKMTKRFEGQANTISALVAPSPGFPYALVGDVNGTVRVWDVPVPKARVISRISQTPFGARFAPDGSALAVYGDSFISLVRLNDGSMTELRGHTDMVGGVRYSSDGHSLMSFSWDETARIWRTSDGAQLRTFTNHQSVVEDGTFVSHGERVVTIGDDGRLFAWDPQANSVGLLLTHDAPLISLEILSGSTDIAVRDAVGTLWVIALDGHIKSVHKGIDAYATSMRSSKDGRLLAIGREDGSMTLYRTTDWTVAKSLALGGTIARLEFDPQGRDMLVQSENGFVDLVSLDARRSSQWQHFQVDARDIAYDRDGDVLAISAIDGGSWFYSMQRNVWSYQQDHMTELCYGRFSPDGSRFVSIDRDGTIVVRDSSTLFN